MTQPKGTTTHTDMDPPGAICEREGCGVSFVPGRPWQKYCSAGCRQAAWLKRHPKYIRLKPGDSVTITVDD